MRRLPLYIVVETSTQMSDVIHLVNDSIQKLIGWVRNDPYSLESLFISVLTFDSDTKVLFPLTELSLIQIEEIVVSNNDANVSMCLSLLNKKIDEEVTKSTAILKGDWKPMLIWITNDSNINSQVFENEFKNFTDIKFGHKVLFSKNVLNENCDFVKSFEYVFNIDNSMVDNLFNTEMFVWRNINICIPNPISSIDLLHNELQPPPPEVSFII